MFQFPPFASAHQGADNYPSGNWVVPFGNRGIKGHLHLPRAYRSLSRPSSPPGAKASTRRPCSLSPVKLNTLPAGSKLPAAVVLGRCGKKVDKGAWRMPWLTEATKDVISCDKPRLGANDP